MRLLANVLWGFLNIWLAVAAFQLDLTTNGFVAYGIFLLMLFLAVIIHEAGHAIAAQRMGAKVAVLAAMFFEYDFEHRKFGWMRSVRHREIAGFVLYRWPMGAGTFRKEAIITAAGPLSNLAAAALAVALVPLFAATPPAPATVEIVPIGSSGGALQNSPVARLPSSEEINRALAEIDAAERPEAFRKFIEAALQVFALLSVGVGVINLVPFDGSDGDRLRKYWARGRAR